VQTGNTRDTLHEDSPAARWIWGCVAPGAGLDAVVESISHRKIIVVVIIIIIIIQPITY